MFAKRPRVIYISDDEDELSEEEPIKDVEAKNFVEEEQPQVRLRYDLHIDGVAVEMPVKPYPCQEAVIKAIINGCETKQHCLLESPTGSGKTLALLCGSLAWQSHFETKRLTKDATEKKETEGTKVLKDDSFSPCKGACAPDDHEMLDDFDLDGFDWADNNFTNIDIRDIDRVPKIYYGSRTHRQIEQVIRELRKTCYSNKNMTVLSSRDFTCIQNTDRDKTQLCNELLDPSKKCGCPYYTEKNKQDLGTISGLISNGVQTPWDIEDLVEAGQNSLACPYFAARALMGTADIIFCPYNYIIDPAIRESMQIDLKGCIVILDEAHNIENICRECGSVSMFIPDLEMIIENCESVIKVASIHKQTHRIGYTGPIIHFCQKLQQFIQTTPLRRQEQGDSYDSDQWTGVDFVNLLDIQKLITSKDILRFMSAAADAASSLRMAKEALRSGERDIPPTLSAEVIRHVEKMLMAFKMVTSPVHATDYRCIVKQNPFAFKKEKCVEFMCMNPGVIFGPICGLARTVILASGTLAPTSSYQGELGVKFPFVIQADHVTPQDQVFIKCVSKGPRGKSLRATYQNVNTWDFQDDLGEVLLTACEAMPHGILMFFSSYSTMGTLLKRWKMNGLWNKLARVKEIFTETRGSGDLSAMMKSYRDSIVATSDGPMGTTTGALLFAVFRGKVAEGIDFSDNEARCVLTVGIPYAVRKEAGTDMKYKYNDLNRGRGLLSGNEWYTIQAFRALNQALGRVIRHQNDWGAIILVDDRFLETRNINMLPSWVRTMWLQQTGMNSELRHLLKGFVARQIRREKGKALLEAAGNTIEID